MRVVLSFILSAFALGLSAVSAHASPITINADFSASGFGVGAPVDPVTGSFSIAFDNAIDVSNDISGISITNLNIPVGSAPAFSYVASIDFLQIGGLENGVGGLSGGTNDFLLNIQNVSTNPEFEALEYTVVAGGGFGASEGEVIPSGPSAIPEPATLSLLGLGLAGMAGRRWRQRKA